VINYVFVDGFTAVPRADAIERLKHSIAIADGVIVDFAFFGREAIRLTVELDAGGLELLQRSLAADEIELFARSSRELESARSMHRERPLLAMLHIVFAQAAAGPSPEIGAGAPGHH
jgi:hypothetical protein